jgi:hypothetical protein
LLKKIGSSTTPLSFSIQYQIKTNRRQLSKLDNYSKTMNLLTAHIEASFSSNCIPRYQKPMAMASPNKVAEEVLFREFQRKREANGRAVPEVIQSMRETAKPRGIMFTRRRLSNDGGDATELWPLQSGSVEAIQVLPKGIVVTKGKSSGKGADMETEDSSKSAKSGNSGGSGAICYIRHGLIR